MKKPTSSRSRFTPDAATIAGILLAFGSILGGLVLEGGQVADLAQLTAALIVLGGTLGAVLVTTPIRGFLDAARKLPSIFCECHLPAEETVEQILALAVIARRSGIASMEKQLGEINNEFLKKALRLSIDGMGVQEIRQIMDLEIAQEELRLEADVKVFEAAGGYAPTVGIIGAVLGLIQVMKHLENISEVGRGIATSFVATVYGVALANLCLLPAANKLKARASQAIQIRELSLEGAIGIVEGMNPSMIRVKLDAYLQKSSEQDARSAAGPVAVPAFPR